MFSLRSKIRVDFLKATTPIIYFVMLIMLAECFAVNSTISGLALNQTETSKLSCATIEFQKLEIPTIPDLNLFQDSVINHREFERVRFDLDDTLFVVPGETMTNSSLKDMKCVLQICGGIISNKGSNACRSYTKPETEAPDDIYTDEFMAYSMSCACKSKSKEDKCTNQTCLSVNATQKWDDKTCAIMFQENHCQNCYFNPIVLQNHTTFYSFNSYQIFAVIVRPNCLLQRYTTGSGFFVHDYTIIDNYTGIVDLIRPSYHRNSENFTCSCPPDNSLHQNDVIIPLLCGLGAALFSVVVIIVLYSNRARIFYRNKNSERNVLLDSSETLARSNEDDDGEEVEVAISNTEQNNQLKTEILEEMKNLLDSFLATIGYYKNDDAEEWEENSNFPAVPYVQVSVLTNENIMASTITQLGEYCDVSKILERGSFTISRENWENPLGVGRQGIVYQGLLGIGEVDQIPVAVKKIREEEQKAFLREVKSLVRVGTGVNEHIVKFLGACCHFDGFYILTEFCAGGSLRTHLLEILRTDRRTIRTAQIIQLLKWCSEICSGMEYLAVHEIIHVDLAVRNLLLSENARIKICDFGLSKKCRNQEACAQSLLTGDFPYNSFAPECNPINLHGPRLVSLYVDIWAFGCTLWEIFTLGDIIYGHVHMQGPWRLLEIRNLLLKRWRHPKPDIATESVYRKMLECWAEIPEERPSFGHLREFFEQEQVNVMGR